MGPCLENGSMGMIFFAQGLTTSRKKGRILRRIKSECKWGAGPLRPLRSLKILRIYVCFSDVFIGGFGPPFYFPCAFDRRASGSVGRDAEAGGFDYACFAPECASRARNVVQWHPRT